MGEQKLPIHMAKNIAYQLHRQYPMAARDDILQEISLFCIEEKLTTPDESLEDDEYNAASQALRRKLRKAGDRFCRTEKAASSGYDVEDEAFYSIERLKELRANSAKVEMLERGRKGNSEWIVTWRSASNF